MILKQLGARLFTSGLKRFSNLHQGGSCYILGDGPSVKWFDLNEFAGLPAICCGMIPFHRDFRKLNAKYITFVAPRLFLPKLLQPRIHYALGGIVAEYRKLIDRSPDKEFFLSLSNWPSVSGKNINFVYRGLPEERNETDERLAGFDLFSGSFYASLGLAYYLGFSKVYLVGFDGWTIQPSRAAHWYEFGEGRFFEPTNLAIEFLQTLQAQIDICTISLDGESSNVRNVRYEVHTGKCPQYKENYELLDEHSLSVLATYPGYRIFPE